MIRPIGKRVFVEKVSAEVIDQGIIIPDPKNKHIGIVRFAGNGTSVKVGDIVSLPRYSGETVKVEGKEYSVLKDDDILGVLGKS